MNKEIIKDLFFALKVSIAACIAILLAAVLKLQFPIAAGIVAILSVATTKKETIKTALNRYLAFCVALSIAFVVFNTMGISNYSFMVYLVIFLFICQFMKWNSAMAMDSVLISHFVSLGNMNIESVYNEIMLFIIGVGIGIVANLFLRKKTDYVESLKNQTDDKIKYVLHRMSLRILDDKLEDYTGSCFEELRASVNEASVIAKENHMNQLFSKVDKDMEYISMRERQIEVLYDMFKRVSIIHTVPISAQILADFFEKVSLEFDRDNTVEDLLSAFKEVDMRMKDLPLPKDRVEFEDRASLYALMRNMEEFLTIKRRYVKNL